MSAPRPPRLPHPSSSPRVTANGRQDRGRPIFHRGAGSTEDLTFWEVEVTPLVATSTTGRDVNPAHGESGPAQLRDRVVFEVRAVFYGVGHPVFGNILGTRRVEETHTEDVDLAKAIAEACVEVLGPGARRLEIRELARDVERRRAG